MFLSFVYLAKMWLWWRSLPSWWRWFYRCCLANSMIFTLFGEDVFVHIYFFSSQQLRHSLRPTVVTQHILCRSMAVPPHPPPLRFFFPARFCPLATSGGAARWGAGTPEVRATASGPLHHGRTEQMLRYLSFSTVPSDCSAKVKGREWLSATYGRGCGWNLKISLSVLFILQNCLK